VHLQAPHPDGFPLRKELQLLLPRDRPRHQAPCDHRSEPDHEERSIDRETCGSRGPRRFPIGTREVEKRRAQPVDSLARARGNRDDGRALEKRTAHELRDVLGRDRRELARRAIDLRHRDDPPFEPE
jgi:hypothetical protein